MSLHRHLLRVSLALVVAASGAALAEGPFAIRTPQLMVPDEAAGSGLSPEVAVRLAIDERGRVSAVDVRSITPASDFDAFFRKEVVETLSEWRFAPATKDGMPVVRTSMTAESDVALAVGDLGRCVRRARCRRPTHRGGHGDGRVRRERQSERGSGRTSRQASAGGSREELGR